jgi:hypothetical protein
MPPAAAEPAGAVAATAAGEEKNQMIRTAIVVLSLGFLSFIAVVETCRNGDKLDTIAKLEAEIESRGAKLRRYAVVYQGALESRRCPGMLIPPPPGSYPRAIEMHALRARLEQLETEAEIERAAEEIRRRRAAVGNQPEA